MTKAIRQIAVLVILCGGCSAWHGSKIGDQSGHAGGIFKSLPTAGEMHARAIKKLQSYHYGQAEKLLKEIIFEDDGYGPAHNSLGSLYFAQKKYYAAAIEFDRAAQLMPDKPEPLNNLGMVYENVGRLDSSVTLYDQAHAMEPTNPEFLGNLVRAKSRRGDDPLELREMLESLVFLEQRPEWTAWANEKLNTGLIGRLADSEGIIEEVRKVDGNSTIQFGDEIESLPIPPRSNLPQDQLPAPQLMAPPLPIRENL